MSEIVQNTSSALVGVSITSSTTVATGLLDTINVYAPLIGLCLSFTSIMLAIMFFAISHKREGVKHRNYIEDLRYSLKEEIITEMMDDRGRPNGT
jgi:hypothetical protein